MYFPQMNVGSSQKKLCLLKLHSVLVKRSSIEPGNREKNPLINDNYGSGAINENIVQLGKTKRKIIRKSGKIFNRSSADIHSFVCVCEIIALFLCKASNFILTSLIWESSKVVNNEYRFLCLNYYFNILNMCQVLSYAYPCITSFTCYMQYMHYVGKAIPGHK